ncbi:hypothetical protein G6F65_017089 [Rhizopus arrhizus]|nr:hypothetical protein G6F65_017089 [Rhizopus arrhizus]
MQGKQVLYIVGGVLQLRLRKWAAHPVRAGFALGQGHASDFRHQLLVTHATTYAGQRGTDLGVEQRARQHAAGPLERDQVFAGAVHHLGDRFIGQPRCQRFGHAGNQRVDQQDVLPDGHLHQRQLRPEGAFTDEFGVEADAARTLLEVRIQLGGGGDPGCHGSGPTTRVCSGRGE